MKKTFWYSIVPVAIIIVIFTYVSVARKNTPAPVVSSNDSSLCFYKKQTYGPELTDVSYLRMTITGNTVLGEYQSIPAEKDKKGGSFSGAITGLPQEQRIADVVWKADGEGVTNDEQLRIAFTANEAKIGFGEMVLKKGTTDTYIYKDVSMISYGDEMSSLACSEL